MAQLAQLTAAPATVWISNRSMFIELDRYTNTHLYQRHPDVTTCRSRPPARAPGRDSATATVDYADGRGSDYRAAGGAGHEREEKAERIRIISRINWIMHVASSGIN